MTGPRHVVLGRADHPMLVFDGQGQLVPATRWQRFLFALGERWRKATRCLRRRR